VSITLTRYYKSSVEPWIVPLHRSGPRGRPPIRYDDPAEVFPAYLRSASIANAILAVEAIGRAP